LIIEFGYLIQSLYQTEYRTRLEPVSLIPRQRWSIGHRHCRLREGGSHRTWESSVTRKDDAITENLPQTSY